MPLNSYGVLVGRAVDCRREGGTDSPHYQVRIDAAGTSYRIAVNVLSSESPSELLYLADDDFRHPVTAAVAGLGAGWHPQQSRPGGAALDFIRGNLFARPGMRTLPPDAAGPDNDLADFLDHYVKRAIADPAALVYAFGERWGPESATKDKVFGFKPGNGVHDIHMNQGNSARFRGDDGVWQDGGLLLRLDGRWVGIFLAFQSQAWHTDDRTGHAIAAPAPTPVPVPQPGPVSDATEIRILAAMVNPLGGSPERETVLLLNASPRAVDLTGWTLADRMKETCALPPGPLAAGQTLSVTLEQRRRARQQGRLDHAARPRRPEGRGRRLHRRAGARGGLDHHVLTSAASPSASCMKPAASTGLGRCRAAPSSSERSRSAASVEDVTTTVCIPRRRAAFAHWDSSS